MDKIYFDLRQVALSSMENRFAVPSIARTLSHR